MKTHVLSSAVKHFAAKLFPKYGTLCRVVIKISLTVYEVRDEIGKKVTRVDINELKIDVVPTLIDGPSPAHRIQGLGSSHIYIN